MIPLSLLVGFLLQVSALAPAPPPSSSVIVGLQDGEKLTLADPQFTGFIQTRDNDSVLLYKQKDFHGELKVNNIQRIDVHYRKGRPYDLSVALKNGQKLDVQSDKRDFLTVKGATDSGFVTIKNPDPLSPKIRLSSHPQNRKHDQTIQYLEFPR